MVVRQADFTGVATKAGLECTDGRTIMPHAFADQDGEKVPLVWSHGHNDPDLVLGHAVLRKNSDGDMECDAYFNPDLPKAVSTKKLVEHGDVNALSVYANRLIEKGKKVFGGKIKEVSVVLAGANPGALIKQVNLAHSEYDEEELEAFIFTGLRLMHADGTPFPEVEDADAEEPSQEELDAEDENEEQTDDGEAEHADTDTLEVVWDSMSDEQKTLAKHMVKIALEHGDDDTENITHEDQDLNDQEGNTEMGHNAFEQDGAGDGTTATATGSEPERTLSHSDFNEIKELWKSTGSMRAAMKTFALAHGIENLDSLFPDPKALEAEPQFDMRRQEGVATILGSVRHTPFSRIKTLWSDITHDEARALGYIKGNLKKEEFFGIKKRTTSPGWVYKKQKLDRQDIIDATEVRVVAWMKAEMQIMLKEEIARGILVGDGRPLEDPLNPGEPNPDKVPDPQGETNGEGIRSILHDDELFVATVNVELPTDGDYLPLTEEVMLAMELYKGSGSPTLFTTLGRLNRMLLSKDGFNRKMWRNKGELATEMGVADIVTLDFMNDPAYDDCFGIIVNLADYNVGTDAGGEVTLFDDFDIDYNQYKYLIETRFSGALVKIRSALRVMIRAAADTELADPPAPAFNANTGVVTVPTAANVTYKDASDDSTLTAGAQPALANGETLEVYAVPAAGYYFANSEVDGPWEFTKRA